MIISLVNPNLSECNLKEVLGYREGESEWKGSMRAQIPAVRSYRGRGGEWKGFMRAHITAVRDTISSLKRNTLCNILPF